jgi:hypothetical protein
MRFSTHGRDTRSRSSGPDAGEQYAVGLDAAHADVDPGRKGVVQQAAQPFAGLNPRCFAKSVTAVRRETAIGGRLGRPLSDSDRVPGDP